MIRILLIIAIVFTATSAYAQLWIEKRHWVYADGSRTIEPKNEIGAVYLENGKTVKTVLDIVMKNGKVKSGSTFKGTSPNDVELYFFWKDKEYRLVDPHNRGEIMLDIKMSCTNGTLDLIDNANLNYTVGDGKEDRAIEFTGTISDVNSVIKNIGYIPDVDDGPGIWHLAVTHANSGPINQPPKIHIPDAYMLINWQPTRHALPNDMQMPQGRSIIRDLKLTGGDADTEYTVSLEVEHGELDLRQSIGLHTIHSPSKKIIRGKIADINNAIDMIEYYPYEMTQDFLSITIDGEGENQPPKIHIPEKYTEAEMIGAYLVCKTGEDEYCVAVSFLATHSKSETFVDTGNLDFSRRDSLGVVYRCSGEDVKRSLGTELTLPTRRVNGAIWKLW